MDPQQIDSRILWSFLAVLFSIIGNVRYIWETSNIRNNDVAKNVRLTISGWVSWTAADVAIFVAMIFNETIAWQVVIYVLGSTVIILLSLRKNRLVAHVREEAVSWKSALSDWDVRDSACVIIVAMGIVAWIIKNNLDYSVYLSILALFIGEWAVARRLWYNPNCESLFAWIFFLLGGICGVAAIRVWDMAGAGAPISYMIQQILTVVLTLRRFLPRFANST